MLLTENPSYPVDPSGRNPIGVTMGAVLTIARLLLASAPVLLLMPGSSHEQITFERTYGGEWFDEGHSVQQTGDGAYIVAGTSNSFGTLSNDVYLLKIDSLGDTMWSKMCGGDRHESGWSVDQTSDSGFVVAAVTETYLPDSADVYVIRTDSVGGVVWEKTYGGVLLDYARCVRRTTEGGYIIAGLTTSFGLGGFDAYLIKTDSDGEATWERTYGGSLEDYSYSAQQTLDGGYVIAGGTTSFGMGDHDIYFVKTDSLGDRIWSRTYGGSSSESARSVQQTDDGGFIICGYTRSFGEGESDVYLVRTDSMGNAIWARTYGGNSWEDAECVRQTQDGGYVLVGRTSSYAVMNNAVYIVKTDPLGDTLWTRVYGSRDSWGYGIEQTPDGGYIVAGYYDDIPPQLRDVYLIKTDENGLVARDMAVVSLDSPGDTVFSDSTYSVRATVQNLLLGFPTVDATVAIDGYTDTVQVRGLPLDSLHCVTFSDWLVPPADSATYTMTVCVHALGDTNSSNDCMQRTIFAYDPTGVQEENDRPVAPDFRLRENTPDPFPHSTTISYSLPARTEVTLTIYDITGRMVETLVNETQEPGIHRVLWDRETNRSGVYFYRLKAGEFVETRKMVVVE